MLHIQNADDLIREYGEAAFYVAASRAEWAMMNYDETNTQKWLDIFSETSKKTRTLNTRDI